MTDEHPNLIELPDGKYLVRTQAGFRKLLKDTRVRWDAHGYLPTSHPLVYPSVVDVQGVYGWSARITVVCKPLKEYTEQTLKLLQILQEN